MGAWPTRYKVVTDAAERFTYVHHKFTTASRPLFKMTLDLTTHCGQNGEFEAKAVGFGSTKTVTLVIKGEEFMYVISGSYSYIAAVKTRKGQQ